MSAFYISVKKDGQIFCGLEKISIDLNPSSNIVGQANNFVASMLSTMNFSCSEDEYAWKVYRLKASNFRFVTMSNNWVGD